MGSNEEQRRHACGRLCCDLAPPPHDPPPLGLRRDDVIFLIYVYQRWIYPIDKKRVNEFGFSGARAGACASAPAHAHIALGSVFEAFHVALGDLRRHALHVTKSYVKSFKHAAQGDVGSSGIKNTPLLPSAHPPGAGGVERVPACCCLAAAQASRQTSSSSSSS